MSETENDLLKIAEHCDGLCQSAAANRNFPVACQAAEASLAITPDNPARLFNLALLKIEQGEIDEAQHLFAKALANGLPGIPYARQFASSHSNYLCQLSYSPQISRQEIALAHRRWFDLHGAHLKPQPHRPPSPRNKLRIGMVSGDFYSHPAGMLIFSILEKFDRTRFELIAYSTNPFKDSLSRYISSLVSRYDDINNLEDEELATRIQSDNIDILIDLSGHTKGNRLGVFCLKPAPIQASFLGYWETTGIPRIDYIIFDRDIAPETEDEYCQETVLRFSQSRFIYRPPGFTPEIADKSSYSGPARLVCFNNINKINDQVISAWGQILRNLPGSKLKIRWKTLNDPIARAAFVSRLVAGGLPEESLEVMGETTYDKILAEYNDADLALDPFPFSGGMTSFDALWMGVPVLCLRGDRPVGRQTESILRQLQHEELIASDPNDYVSRATHLANDRTLRNQIAGDLRNRFSQLILERMESYVEDFEAMLETMWTMHCHKKGWHYRSFQSGN